MNLSQRDYLNQIAIEAKKRLKNEYQFSNTNLSLFHLINAFLLQYIYNVESTNILITLPTNVRYKEVIDAAILIPVLKCFSQNTTIDKSVNVGDVIIKADCGTISSVKSVNGGLTQILPILKTKRTELDIANPFLLVSHKVKAKIGEIESRATLAQKQKGLENLRSKLLEEIQQYLTITEYFLDGKISIPSMHQSKVVVVASKKDFPSSLPSFVPYQYINKSGEVSSFTSFDPILYVVNDFSTVHEFILEKGIGVDTIVFIGDNKYKTITAISRLFRQKRFKRCIFIGAEDIESADKFRVVKWNWTLPETKHFYNATNSKINTIEVPDPKLSSSIRKYIKIIDDAEQQNEHLINLKKSLRYIRKLYPITALDDERIKSRANDIFMNFEKEVEELFQDEYQSIDRDYRPDFEMLKDQFKEIIRLIKLENAKAGWLKNQTENIDYIIVPKVIKSFWEKEIDKCWQTQFVPIKIKNLADLNNIQPKERSNQFYNGFKSTKVITLREFELMEPDRKNYLFISFYGYGVYPETLLEKIYNKNVISEILLYEEEHKAFQYHLHKFNERINKEFHSADREELSGIKYSESQNIVTENIDEWIKFLIDSENFKFSKKEEIRYEITFAEESKKIKERESKGVYIEGYEEHQREISQLKIDDRVRIYQNPDIETLHDIIKMTDEKELFLRVDRLSNFWKSCLKNYSGSKSVTYTLENLFDELQANGLSVSKNQLENWLHRDNKTKFPKRKIDFSAIVKTVNNEELNTNWKFIMETSKEYLGTLNHKGRKFADEIENYIITKEKGEMLSWLSDNHIEKIINIGAPLRTIKEIKKLDYEITD